MSPLEHLQAAVAETLAHGPAHLPPALFAGEPTRVLLGLKAHANTISHARLVAVEDTFPHTRAALGHGGFHMLSRAYLDMPGTTSVPLADIGLAFPSFLAAQGVGYGVVDLARAEWAWLLAWRAAEAQPFDLTAIAGLPEPALLATRVGAHPAAHLLSLTEPAGAAFRPFGDVCGARILMFTRPAEAVLVTPIDAASRALFVRLKAMSATHAVTMGDLLSRLLEEADDEDPAAAFLAMASIGTMTLPKDQNK